MKSNSLKRKLHIIHYPLILILLFNIFFIPSSSGQDTNTIKNKPGVITEHHRGLHGYISYDADRPADKAHYGYGMGFYSAVWPLISEPLKDFQIGLAGSWIIPDNSDNKDKPLAPIGTHARDNWPKRGPTYSLSLIHI